MVAWLGLTYLVAAIPFGLVITTLYGDDTDIRHAGSGNIGATNVARVYGWGLAGPVLFFDVAKGLVPVALARLIWPEAGMWWPSLVALVAFAAHCWSAYLEFRGGKGVATGAGTMFALAPGPTGAAAIVWVGLLAATGRSSVAALVSTATLVVLCVWLASPVAVFTVVALAIGVAFTHLTNIRRLVRGEETQVIRPVRWGRAEGLSAEQLLSQAPGGVAGPASLWRDDADPLEPD